MYTNSAMVQSAKDIEINMVYVAGSYRVITQGIFNKTVCLCPLSDVHQYYLSGEATLRREIMKDILCA